jgi:hypothetical protein
MRILTQVLGLPDNLFDNLSNVCLTTLTTILSQALGLACSEVATVFGVTGLGALPAHPTRKGSVQIVIPNDLLGSVVSHPKQITPQDISPR